MLPPKVFFITSIVFAYAELLFKVNGYRIKRVIGGEDADIHVLPYVASIQRNGNLFCGGSIISEYWILTTAHCTDGPPQIFKVRVGSKKLTEGGDLIPVEEFMRHEKYHVERICTNEECTTSKIETFHDIALVHLQRPIIFSETQQPIPLFETNELAPTGELAIVCGWGDLGNETYPDILQSATVPIVSKEECSGIYPNLTDDEICAGYVTSGGRDACNYDSGGPLAIDGRLAGIVLEGHGCGIQGYPGVYIEVSYYRTWIQKKSGV